MMKAIFPSLAIVRNSQFQILYKQMVSSFHTAARSYNVNYDQKSLDPQQNLLLEEPCILVDTKDHVTGWASKKKCHLMGEKGVPPPLHRAFSVFLFNNKGELLLQQRSENKITFPNHYTNTCCSHPHHVSDELQEEDSKGIKLAAKRRLNFELGIPLEDINTHDLIYLTRIMYASPSDGVWGEHEIDYVLFLKGDYNLAPNDNEISEVKYINSEHFSKFIGELNERNIPISPWFSLIAKSFLPEWWKNLDNLDKYLDHKTIHHMK